MSGKVVSNLSPGKNMSATMPLLVRGNRYLIFRQLFYGSKGYLYSVYCLSRLTIGNLF
jgi:hypothetical protein